MLGVVNHVARRAFLRRPREPVAVRARGLRLVLDPAELTEGLILFAPQLFDRRELRALQRTLRPGDVFLDLGAHVGFYALLAARWVGASGRVLAVEPEPTSRARLLRHVADNGLAQVEVIEVGVSEQDETRTLRRGPPGNRGASGFLRATGEPVEVRCRPVAALLAERGIARVAAAKLDLEGFEHRVLRAWLAPLPAAERPRLLVVEHHPEQIAAAGGDTRALLADLGYQVRRAGRHNLLARLDGPRWSN